MEAHVFAVWDFMSLLKALQRRLTCVETPWTPSESAASRRFLNEIVLDEESDRYEGRTVSHFELYLEAMKDAGADTRRIGEVVERARRGADWKQALPEIARPFVLETFRGIETGSVAEIAAAFTFGREDAIPEMFRELIRGMAADAPELRKFVWYLDRHIELDGDDHGPLAMEMIAELCGEDEEVWERAAVAGENALRARIELWDRIRAAVIESRRGRYDL